MWQPFKKKKETEQEEIKETKKAVSNSVWYSFNKVRSFDRFFSFILSNRGGGKTYGAKKIGINDYIKKGEQFGYIRRYGTEFDTVSEFFNDICEEFEDYEFKADKKQGYIRKKGSKSWEVCCHFFTLSIQKNYKSTPYPKITKVFFDEFIIDTKSGNARYLKNEVRQLLELTSTITRKRDNVRFFFLANNVSLVNPYFTYFNAKIPPNATFVKCDNPQVVIEFFKSEDYIKEVEATKFGQLIKGTEYGDYAINNETLVDNKAFIEERRPSGRLSFLFSIVMNGKEFGAWLTEDNETIYVDYKIEKNSKNRYVITREDHTPDYNIIKSSRHDRKIYRLLSYSNSGAVLYKNQEIKDYIIHALKYIR